MDDGVWNYGNVEFHDEENQQLGIRWYFNDTVAILPISDFWAMHGELVDEVPYQFYMQ